MQHKIESLGWREWISLPELGVKLIKAKIDTGAKTSSLHVTKLETFKKDGKKFVRFTVHPKQRSTKKGVQCETEIHDERFITDSGGHKEMRIIIKTKVQIGGHTLSLEISLANREDLTYRMLVGRSALKDFIVTPNASFLQGKPSSL